MDGDSNWWITVGIPIITFLLGAAASWVITHYYYRLSEKDAADALIATRLDKCIEGDKTFLVALFQAGKPLPRYARITVEYQRKDGTKSSFASGMDTMTRSVEYRVGHCTVGHSIMEHNGIDENNHTLTLSERGEECARYLLRKEYLWAKFTMVEKTPPPRKSG